MKPKKDNTAAVHQQQAHHWRAEAGRIQGQAQQLELERARQAKAFTESFNRERVQAAQLARAESEIALLKGQLQEVGDRLVHSKRAIRTLSRTSREVLALIAGEPEAEAKS